MRRFSARRESLLGLALYAGYMLVRRAVLDGATGSARARANAERIVRLERRLGIDVEPAVQRAVRSAPRLARALSAGYAIANIGLSVGWLTWLFRRRDERFHRERRAAAFAFAGALPVFLACPTAPPRTLDGFVDLLGEHGIDLEHPLLVRFYNPVAAMPSHHAAFAVVTGFALATRRRTLPGRLLARSYAPFVALVVIGTGNHYVLDVVAGAALGAAARRLGR
ncbi:MAG: phosphatase PAP2 family protein [Gaiella sp.]